MVELMSVQNADYRGFSFGYKEYGMDESKLQRMKRVGKRLYLNGNFNPLDSPPHLLANGLFPPLKGIKKLKDRV